jgi:hypothetical protein
MAARSACNITVACTLLTGGCFDGALFSSLGGNTAGGRGRVRLVIINNTPDQAVFTVGTYDPADQSSQPRFEQFGLSDSDRPLLGGQTSDITPLTCGRILSLGGPRMLELIEENLSNAVVIEEALVQGVRFFRRSGEDDAPVLLGEARPLEARLGVDFPCNSIIVLRFELNDVGTESYRIDFEVIPGESTR